jgi:hypothetical protein
MTMTSGQTEALSEAQIALLGIIAKSASPPPFEGLNDADKNTLQKYALQAAARRLLPRERVSKCGRKPIPIVTHVEVLRSEDGSHSTFGGLLTCNSVWHCARCASKISEGRRVELQQAINTWLAHNQVVMLTYTLSHSHLAPLEKTLGILKDSKRAMKAGKPWQKIASRWGIVGSITATEITLGVNGWHPHLHELVFVTGKRLQGSTLVELSQTLKNRWQAIVARLGGSVVRDIGLNFAVSDSKVADYVAKFGHEPSKPYWGEASELTKSNLKKASPTSTTPQGLLWAFLAGERLAGRLWREYALAFKGKRQLVWSAGLAELLGMKEIQSDIELAKEQTDGLQVFALLTFRQWREILTWDNGGQYRLELLQYARAGDLEGFKACLEARGISSNVL